MEPPTRGKEAKSNYWQHAGQSKPQWVFDCWRWNRLNPLPRSENFLSWRGLSQATRLGLETKSRGLSPNIPKNSPSRNCWVRTSTDGLFSRRRAVTDGKGKEPPETERRLSEALFAVKLEARMEVLRSEVVKTTMPWAHFKNKKGGNSWIQSIRL